MHTLAILLIGYSLFSAATLAVTHFNRDRYRDHPWARGAGWLLLAALAVLQGAHLATLQFGLGATDTPAYRIALFVVAPAFHGFSRAVLVPLSPPPSKVAIAAHLLPALMAGMTPTAWALPLAFVIGAGYLVALGRNLYQLRHERAGFQRELGLLGIVLAMALAVSALGLRADALPEQLFFTLYASAIGLAFWLVQLVLGLRPQLSADVQDHAQSVQTAYAKTTLAQVDCEAALQRLQALMRDEQLYTDTELSLASLAERLGLSGHQLSELINTRLGKGFSRYLREHRIAAAKAMLVAEPGASVLSISLSVGFASQSTFYDAFREIAGCTPGQYRQRHRPPPPAN